MSKRRERRLRKREERLKELLAEKQQNIVVQETKKEEKRSKILEFYDKKYKKLLWIPTIVLLLAIIYVGVHYAVTEEFVNRGVSLKGGVTLTILSDKNIDIVDLENYIKKNSKADVTTRFMKSTGTQTGVIIDASDITQEELLKLVTEKVGKLDKNQYTIDSSGSSLGKNFFKEIAVAIIVAFLLMAIVVFIYFKKFVPSIAVILCAFSDIITTIAIINLLGIKLSTAGIAALLMLIGYSIDTDILLTTKLIKEKEGTVFERLLIAMKPGLTMTFTTLAAVFVGLLFAKSEVLSQIFTILFIGLICDLLYTWIQNVSILRSWLEKKHIKKENENIQSA